MKTFLMAAALAAAALTAGAANAAGLPESALPESALPPLTTLSALPPLPAPPAPQATGDTLPQKLQLSAADSLKAGQKEKRNWATWRPNPERALWLALVIPGGGQIYNRKYWKLPIIYGGIMGCLYAMNWNNMMYRDYSQAYLDIMDSDPTTQSYNKFLHLGKKIDSSNEERYKQIFKSRKDKFRRWRDLSFFCLVGVYAISVIDAYVDAELSEFDISKDLSLKVEPTIMNSATGFDARSWQNASLGLNCRLNF